MTQAMRALWLWIPIALCAVAAEAAFGSLFYRLPADVVDPRLKPFVDEFVARAAAENRAFPRVFVRAELVPDALASGPSGKAAAHCQALVALGRRGETIDHGVRVVVGESALAEPTLLKWIVFHELGHCLLGLDHVEREGALMNPRVPSLATAEAMLEQAATEIFRENGATLNLR